MAAIGEILKELTPYLSVLLSMYIWYNTKYDKRVKDKEDLNDKKHTDTLEIIKKIQINVDNHTLMHQSHQQEREKLVGLNDQRIQHIEQKVNQFDNVVPEVQALKLKMEHYTVKIDNLIESIKESKNENKESIKELKDLINKKNTP